MDVYVRAQLNIMHKYISVIFRDMFMSLHHKKTIYKILDVRKSFLKPKFLLKIILIFNLSGRT